MMGPHFMQMVRPLALVALTALLASCAMAPRASMNDAEAKSTGKWAPILRVTVSPHAYSDVAYALPPEPGTYYLHFVGERIAFELSIINAGVDDVPLAFGPAGTLVNATLTASFAKSSRPVQAKYLSKPVIRDTGRDRMLRTPGTLTLPAQQRVVMIVEFADLDVLPPGYYELSFSLPDACATCRMDLHSYRFEVRDLSDPAARNEWLARRVRAASQGGDYASARDAFAELSARAPERAVTWMIGGNLAARQQHWCEAASRYGRALDIAHAGSDPTFRQGSHLEFGQALQLLTRSAAESRAKCR